MENIANKTGIAGLVKKAVGFIGVVAVAGVAAGCVTTGEPPKSVKIPSITPWEAKKVERLGGCVNIGDIYWNNSEPSKIAAKPGKTCIRTIGGNEIELKIINYPKHGKLEVINNNGRSVEWNYTPDSSFNGIDEITLNVTGVKRKGGKYNMTEKIIYYVGDWNYGSNLNIK